MFDIRYSKAAAENKKPQLFLLRLLLLSREGGRMLNYEQGMLNDEVVVDSSFSVPCSIFDIQKPVQKIKKPQPILLRLLLL
ncbi:MAG: hypothetical protein IM584_10730 [Chitinophagaceae bacterium]|nr:hypothetical protein [Chitinophagaceae bacterium]MCA6452462.1 hypothetical protein [Chitinophagaceae bacterium]MCA6456597.1 hypothetical protein [Chitinophagaceae bacterium]MCA6460003.1 hypothetical protein [Chitinophagaceae bacterium]MCA6465862.1 hypothetical protein [Chitinophagaceae bacterium]